MFLVISPEKASRHTGLLQQMFRIRKKVFHDQLGWDVPVKGDIEIDRYDGLTPVYIVWQHEESAQFIGCMRLLPTTGPTLLSDTFRATYPEDVDFQHPTIWEASRTCVDEDALAAHYPDMTPAAAFGMIMLATCEWCLENYVTTIVTNYEPPLKRIYKRAGVRIDEIGRADGYGRQPVCCGLVEISTTLLMDMRSALGASQPLIHERRLHKERAA